MEPDAARVVGFKAVVNQQCAGGHELHRAGIRLLARCGQQRDLHVGGVFVCDGLRVLGIGQLARIVIQIIGRNAIRKQLA